LDIIGSGNEVGDNEIFQSIDSSVCDLNNLIQSQESSLFIRKVIDLRVLGEKQFGPKVVINP